MIGLYRLQWDKTRFKNGAIDKGVAIELKKNSNTTQRRFY